MALHFQFWLFQPATHEDLRKFNENNNLLIRQATRSGLPELDEYTAGLKDILVENHSPLTIASGTQESSWPKKIAQRCNSQK